MNSPPEQEPNHLQNWPEESAGGQGTPAEHSAAAPELVPSLAPEPWRGSSQPGPELPFFLQPQTPPQARIPHIGHVLFLLFALMPMGLLATGLVVAFAMHVHLFGVSTTQRAVTEIHYILGSEGLLYVFTFAMALLVFPLFWHKNLFTGLQWNGATALRLRWWLVSAAVVCFLFAILGGELMPSPSNTPIEKVFRAPGAAWLLFAFGVTFAPFFEETFFRGFLLPSLCTAYDWLVERATGQPLRPLGPNGHPQWSFSAMLVASIATSIPFAALHAEQTGYTIGPFLLLVGVSLVLCAIRLWTRSLASSVLVHASYNFLLFLVMLIGTGGFRHFEKM